ncbi:LysR family transcriptional regulator [Paraburkholderia sp. HD33-4]|uniref:LysR family transcriptional regulator n=1 Tax=Paraburkholderia sp. HD33-4 TaxID=2883242 RepID=UPI001F2C250C|nr:LysR family transcriptional regulator [Paraburkholderia sp. HD33-4]
MANWDRIRTFLRVVERGGFTAAAKQLGAPVTSVSRKVIALEEELGVRLLNRTTRHVSATQAGRELYDRCVQAEAIVDDAERVVRALREEPVGVLKILAPYTLGLTVLEPALTEFRRRYPQVRLELTLDNQPLDLIEHGFDIALHRGTLPDSGYMFRMLGQSRAVLVASPSYLDRAGRPELPEHLLQHALLVLGRVEPATWRLLNPSGSVVEIIVSPAIASNESLALVRQAIGSAGIALASDQLVSRHVEQGKLEVVLPGWQRAEDTDVALLFPSQATLDRKVRLFIDYCVDIFSQIPDLAPNKSRHAATGSTG